MKIKNKMEEITKWLYEIIPKKGESYAVWAFSRKDAAEIAMCELGQKGFRVRALSPEEHCALKESQK